MRGVTLRTAPTTRAAQWSNISLPLLLVLSFAISVGLGLYALASLRSVLVHERGNDLTRTAVGVADTLDRVLFERFGDIQLFANDRILLEGTHVEQSQRLGQYKHFYWYYSWIGITDATGRIIAATDSPAAQDKGQVEAGPEQSVSSPKQPDWFETVRRTGGVYLGDAHRSP
jgi:hypothetical protein